MRITPTAWCATRWATSVTTYSSGTMRWSTAPGSPFAHCRIVSKAPRLAVSLKGRGQAAQREQDAEVQVQAGGVAHQRVEGQGVFGAQRAHRRPGGRDGAHDKQRGQGQQVECGASGDRNE